MIGKINRIGKLGGLNLYRNTNDQHLNMIGRYSTEGKTNEDIDRSIIKDLSNNNSDLTVKNITWDSNNGSGYGGFRITPNDMIIDPLYARISENNPNKVIIFNFKENTPYIKIPTISIGQITRFKITGASWESTFRIGSFLPFSMIEDGTYTYENQFDDVVNDMDDSNGYIQIDHYGKTPIGGEATVEFFYEYPDFLVIPKLASIECSNIKLTNDFTLISKIRYINSDEYFIQDDNFISIKGNNNLISFKYGDSNGLSQKIQLGSKDNTFEIPYETEKYIITSSLFNNKSIIGKETITNEIKNTLIIGGNNCRVALKDLLLYNKSLSDEEVKQEIKKYNL